MKPYILMILLFSLISGNATAKDDVKDDLEKFQGTWKVVSAAEGGQQTPEEHLKDLKMIITLEKMTYKFRDVTTVWPYKLDSTKSPKWFDIMDKDHTLQGIYQLEGDQLKICVPNMGDKGRSTAFESKPNSVNHLLIVMERERP